VSGPEAGTALLPCRAAADREGLVVKYRLLIALFLGLATAIPAAYAQDDDTPAPSPMNLRLQKILAILQTNPDDVSQACVGALKELHKTQDQVAAEQDRNKDQDLEVARDVEESNFEDATQICGVDAQRMCEHDKPQPKLTQACGVLRHQAEQQSSQ